MNTFTARMIVLATALFAGFSLSAFAENEPGGQAGLGAPKESPRAELHGMPEEKRGQFIEKRMQEMDKALGLNEEQAGKMKSLREARAVKMKEYGKNMHIKRAALMAELKKPDYNEAKARELQNEVKNLEALLGDSRFEGLLEIRKILTEKQFSKLLEMMPPMGARNDPREMTGSKKGGKHQRQAVK